ncbi:hypothetical protein C8R43DRAFT_957318 [Mycena crocata]|nr:hypothetical protein C8R43DRAFT_957318 [Mycena crocata]
MSTTSCILRHHQLQMLATGSRRPTGGRVEATHWTTYSAIGSRNPVGGRINIFYTSISSNGPNNTSRLSLVTGNDIQRYNPSTMNGTIKRLNYPFILIFQCTAKPGSLSTGAGGSPVATNRLAMSGQTYLVRHIRARRWSGSGAYICADRAHSDADYGVYPVDRDHATRLSTEQRDNLTAHSQNIRHQLGLVEHGEHSLAVHITLLTAAGTEASAQLVAENLRMLPLLVLGLLKNGDEKATHQDTFS